MDKKKILIVDDSEFDRLLMSKALEKSGGFNVMEVSNGDDCLIKIEQEKIDLILMDVLMPGTVGTQILKKIREKSNYLELPIIMVTAKSDVADIIGALHLGANDYITKPMNFDIAVSRISTHLKLAEASKAMGRIQELSALNAMVTTYNHEINNPLSIAIGNLKKISEDRNDTSAIKRVEESLWRISEIVKKIRDAIHSKDVDYTAYVNSEKMLKIK